MFSGFREGDGMDSLFGRASINQFLGVNVSVIAGFGLHLSEWNYEAASSCPLRQTNGRRRNVLNPGSPKAARFGRRVQT